MAEQLEANKIQVGEQFHILGQALMMRLTREYNGTVIVEPGVSLTLTEEMVSLAEEDSKGSWVDLILDPVAQVSRWGRVRFGAGPASGNQWSYGDPRWEAERRAALEVVWAITEPAARSKALSDVQARFAHGQGQEIEHD